VDTLVVIPQAAGKSRRGPYVANKGGKKEQSTNTCLVGHEHAQTIRKGESVKAISFQQQGMQKRYLRQGVVTDGVAPHVRRSHLPRGEPAIPDGLDANLTGNAQGRVRANLGLVPTQVVVGNARSPGIGVLCAGVNIALK